MKFLIIVLMMLILKRKLTFENYNNQIEDKILKIRFFRYGDYEPFTLELNNKISGKQLKE